MKQTGLILCLLFAVSSVCNAQLINYNVDLSMNHYLEQSRKIKLSVYGEFTSEYLDFFDETKEAYLSNEQRRILEQYNSYSNFILIDNQNFNRMLEEIERQNTGLYDENEIIRAGSLLGANLILVIEGAISMENGLIELTKYYKLIDIETGRILAIDMLEWVKNTITNGPAVCYLNKKLVTSFIRNEGKYIF